MAITYENVIYDRCISSLHTLIADEFSVPVYFDEHEGNQSFVITPVEDSLGELLANGQSRNYTINISYQLDSGRNYSKNSVRQVALIAERLKRLIFNNKNYSSGGSRQFYNAEVNTVEYLRNEDDDNLLEASMEVSMSTLEIV
ncbi:MAG TPA: hypothetical protein DHN29_03730 [Cytophagales bacterium]|nr:hypothetical protein [Cytophagales bacterium]